MPNMITIKVGGEAQPVSGDTGSHFAENHWQYIRNFILAISQIFFGVRRSTRGAK